MSEEQLKAFWEAIQADAGLQQKLQGVTEPDAVAAIAKEAGFSISAEEMGKAQSELTDEQLENVAGGGCLGRGTTFGLFPCAA
jgi:predicted ribosomally synthesized peptide with nif11-like leader